MLGGGRPRGGHGGVGVGGGCLDSGARATWQHLEPKCDLATSSVPSSITASPRSSQRGWVFRNGIWGPGMLQEETGSWACVRFHSYPTLKSLSFRAPCLGEDWKEPAHCALGSSWTCWSPQAAAPYLGHQTLRLSRG